MITQGLVSSMSFLHIFLRNYWGILKNVVIELGGAHL